MRITRASRAVARTSRGVTWRCWRIGRRGGGVGWRCWAVKEVGLDTIIRH